VGSGFLVSKVLKIDIRPRARASGKLVTFLQIVTLFVLLLMPESIRIFMVTVAVASAIAILDYTFVGIAALRRRAEAA
jgi:phosphatidylglycerophosphate synthase